MQNNVEYDLRIYEGPVRTYDDRDAVIRDTDLAEPRSVLVKFRNQKNEWTSARVTPQGVLNNPADPFIVPEAMIIRGLRAFNGKGFTNLRQRGGSVIAGTVYPTLEKALSQRNSNTLATVEALTKDLSKNLSD